MLPPPCVFGKHIGELDAPARLRHHLLDRLTPHSVVFGLFVPRGVLRGPVDLDQHKAGRIVGLLQHIEPRDPRLLHAISGVLDRGLAEDDQFIERYAKRTGRDLSRIGYYEVLGVFKLAVILQQIYYRFRRGQTQDARFQNFGESVRGLVELADSLTGKFS